MNKEQCAETGCVFYAPPSELTPEMIDPLLRKAVFRINESGWVWTAESCQGHPDATENMPWGFNTRPMLRLVTRTGSYGKMLACLLDSACVVDDFLPKALGFDFYPNPHPKQVEWREVLVYVKAATVYDRNLGIRAFEQFAEMVNAPGI